MKNLLTVLIAATVSVSALTAETRPAPEFVVKMTDGTQKLLSSYKGKTVCLAFFYTTCPHCQDTSRLLSQIQVEYAPKGVQVLAAAFNDDAQTLTPEFLRLYVKGFPMGYSDRGAVLEFLQKSIMTPLYVPILTFIDKHGTIIDEYIGDATFLKDPPKNIRAELDKVIAMAPKKPAAKVTKK